MRFGRLRPIARRGPQGKAARRVWETSTDDVRIFGRSSTRERALRSSFGDWRIFPRRGISVPYILVHGDDFFIVDRQEEGKHSLSMLRGAYELSKVVTLGPDRGSHGQRVSWAEH